MIINTITQSQFHDKFHAYNRGDQFTYEALNALYQWLDDLSEDTGEAIKLDVIALCCQFSEYDSFEEVQGAYRDIGDIGDLYDQTTVIELSNGGLVIADF